jgi:hypothetical protein
MIRTHILFLITFNSLIVWDIVEKYGWPRQAAYDKRVLHIGTARWIIKATVQIAQENRVGQTEVNKIIKINNQDKLDFNEAITETTHDSKVPTIQISSGSIAMSVKCCKLWWMLLGKAWII